MSLDLLRRFNLPLFLGVLARGRALAVGNCAAQVRGFQNHETPFAAAADAGLRAVLRFEPNLTRIQARTHAFQD